MSSSSHREPKAVLVEQRVALVQQQMKSAKEEVLGHAQTLLLMRGNRDDETELKGPTTFSQVLLETAVVPEGGWPLPPNLPDYPTWELYNNLLTRSDRSDIFACLVANYPSNLWVSFKSKGFVDSVKTNNLCHMCWDLAIHVKPAWRNEPWKSSLRSTRMGKSVHGK